MLQLARWLTFIEEFDYKIEHCRSAKHGNADGLSRPTTPSVRAIKKNGKCQKNASASMAQSLAERQLRDAEIGTFVSFWLERDNPPGRNELQSESELTKQFVSNWSRFEVHDSLVFRRYQHTPKEDGDYLQLLLPRIDVRNVLNQCHGGVLGGHFGETKTMDQVRRRFYWYRWKEDVHASLL